MIAIETDYPEALFYKVLVKDCHAGSTYVTFNRTSAHFMAGTIDLSLEWQVDPESGIESTTRPDGIEVQIVGIPVDGIVRKALDTLIAAGIDTAEKFERAQRLTGLTEIVKD